MRGFLGVKAPGIIDFPYIEKTDWYPFLSESSSSGLDYWKALYENLSKVWLNPLEYPGERIKEINIPVLILVGDRDEINSVETNVRMFRMIQKAELAIIPNTAHIWDELFTELTLDFYLRHTNIPK